MTTDSTDELDAEAGVMFSVWCMMCRKRRSSS